MKSDIPEDILKKVTQRTKDHIARVKYFYRLLSKDYIPFNYYNGSEVIFHDEDKLEPENLRRQALRYCYTPDELTPENEKEIQDVVREHVKSNKHHCEYWGDGDHTAKNMDCSDMPMKYLYEMLADWAATAEERGGKIRDWYNKCVVNVGGNRWKFRENQIEVMEPCIEFLDKHLDSSMKRDYGLTFIDPAFLKRK